jgi:hypothetical protein
MEGRLSPGVVGIGVIVGTELLVSVVHHVLPAPVVRLAIAGRLEARRLDANGLGRLSEGGRQLMAEVAFHPVAIATRGEAGAICRRRTLCQPALGRMTTKAEIARSIEVLLRNCDRRPEEGIRRGMRHHAAIPEMRRLGSRVVAPMAIVAAIGRLEAGHFAGLGTGHLHGGRHNIRGARRDRVDKGACKKANSEGCKEQPSRRREFEIHFHPTLRSCASIPTFPFKIVTSRAIAMGGPHFSLDPTLESALLSAEGAPWTSSYETRLRS